MRLPSHRTRPTGLQVTAVSRGDRYHETQNSSLHHRSRSAVRCAARRSAAEITQGAYVMVPPVRTIESADVSPTAPGGANAITPPVTVSWAPAACTAPPVTSRPVTASGPTIVAVPP